MAPQWSDYEKDLLKRMLDEHGGDWENIERIFKNDPNAQDRNTNALYLKYYKDFMEDDDGIGRPDSSSSKRPSSAAAATHRGWADDPPAQVDQRIGKGAHAAGWRCSTSNGNYAIFSPDDTKYTRPRDAKAAFEQASMRTPPVATNGARNSPHAMPPVARPLPALTPAPPPPDHPVTFALAGDSIAASVVSGEDEFSTPRPCAEFDAVFGGASKIRLEGGGSKGLNFPLFHEVLVPEKRWSGVSEQLKQSLRAIKSADGIPIGGVVQQIFNNDIPTEYGHESYELSKFKQNVKSNQLLLLDGYRKKPGFGDKPVLIVGVYQPDKPNSANALNNALKEVAQQHPTNTYFLEIAGPLALVDRPAQHRAMLAAAASAASASTAAASVMAPASSVLTEDHIHLKEEGLDIVRKLIYDELCRICHTHRLGRAGGAGSAGSARGAAAAAGAPAAAAAAAAPARWHNTKAWKEDKDAVLAELMKLEQTAVDDKLRAAEAKLRVASSGIRGLPQDEVSSPHTLTREHISLLLLTAPASQALLTESDYVEKKKGIMEEMAKAIRDNNEDETLRLSNDLTVAKRGLEAVTSHTAASREYQAAQDEVEAMRKQGHVGPALQKKRKLEQVYGEYEAAVKKGREKHRELLADMESIRNDMRAGGQGAAQAGSSSSDPLPPPA